MSGPGTQQKHRERARPRSSSKEFAFELQRGGTRVCGMISGNTPEAAPPFEPLAPNRRWQSQRATVEVCLAFSEGISPSDRRQAGARPHTQNAQGLLPRRSAISAGWDWCLRPNPLARTAPPGLS